MPTGRSLRVVLDTSPLIVLSKLGLLREGIELFEEAEIPTGVLREVVRKEDSVSSEVLHYVREGLIKVEKKEEEFPRIGLGESSAISLALERRKTVVLDDKRARRIARELGLTVLGSLSILKKLVRENPKMSLNTLYWRLIEIGFYVDRRLFDELFSDLR